jgi:glycosyltransferase involved in cell wall biosynthesis
MKTILVITFTNLKNDARVRRQINALKDKYQVIAACLEADSTGEYDLILLKKQNLILIRKLIIGLFLLTKQFKKALQLLHPYFYLTKDLIDKKIDFVIANDIESLPLAFEIADQKKCKLMFDAHEYAPRHFEDKWVWRIFFQPLNVYLCKKYIHRTSVMTTIGRGLANEYEKHFHIKPVVITNANHFYQLSPSPVSDSVIRLVHHGIATPSRKLELMIEMMEHMDERFTLDMYLLSSGFLSGKTKNYPEVLKRRASGNPRIRILPPIKSEQIVSRINEYDIGVFLIPPINFNYENTLPNKLFDFIQARLAIAVGPTPEMAEIINKFNLGVVSKDFNPRSLAEKLVEINSDQLRRFKQNASLAAAELNAEKNNKTLITLVEQALEEN